MWGQEDIGRPPLFPSPPSLFSRRAVALVLLGMLALSHAAPAPVDAAEEKTEWVTEDGVLADDAPTVGDATGPAGSIIIPSSADGGTAKFVHAMVASQVG